MSIQESALHRITQTKLGTRLVEDKRYRVITKAVLSLIFNLLYAFYNGLLGFLSSSTIFIASAVYHFLLSAMRFSVVLLNKKKKAENDRLIASMVGVLLIILSVIFHFMIFISMRENTATMYGTVTMITIATFTFTKITTAVVTAIKHRSEQSKLFKALNAVRYSEVAVSLLTMQQSMLVSFGGTADISSVILNACTGAAVCFFILALGITTLANNRKEL